MPSKPSSPTAAKLSGVQALSGRICSSPSKTPSAIGKSKIGPCFLMSAGARLTVMRRRGQVKPLFFIAARTRSPASRTAASGRPTTENEAKFDDTSTSTRTIYASTPSTAKASTRANIRQPPRLDLSYCVNTIRHDDYNGLMASARKNVLQVLAGRLDSFDVIESVGVKCDTWRAVVVAEPDFDDIETAGGRSGMVRNVGVGQTANLALFGGSDGFLRCAKSIRGARFDFDETQNLTARTVLPRDAVDFTTHSAALAVLTRQRGTPVALDNTIAARFQKARG